MPAQTVEIKKMVDPASQTPGQAKIDPKALENATEESVTVPAGTFKAKVIEQSGSIPGGNTYKSKVWFCEEVPGGVVKMEMSTDGAMKSTMTSELKEIDKK
jgi:hypothetical protein